ncbi:MAG: nucleoside deaminase [Spirochaetia bacterium]|nr:nucleoside deaminase [Spirochaetia bacterium]
MPPRFFEEALALAQEAAASGEVPVGAMVLQHSPDGVWNVIGRGRNRILELSDPTAHAEILAVRDACATVRSERLLDSVLVSTLEPCPMCAGAVILARIGDVIFFAPTGTGIGLVEFLELSQKADRFLNHYPSVRSEPLYSEQSAQLLRRFFAAKRAEGPANPPE